MKFSEMVDQAVEFLQRRARVSYRALKREFELDDESLEDLKAELIEAQRIAVDEDGKVLVWVGDTEKDSQSSERQNITRPLRCKRIRGAPSQEGECLIENKVARVAAPGQLFEHLLRSSRLIVILVSRKMAGHKGSSINIDHEEWGSSYR